MEKKKIHKELNFINKFKKFNNVKCINYLKNNTKIKRKYYKMHSMPLDWRRKHICKTFTQ